MKPRILFSILVLALALVPAAWAQQATPAAGGAGVTVIQNATILTVTKGTIEGGSILIRNGKIAEVGKNVRAPAGATDFDAKGM